MRNLFKLIFGVLLIASPALADEKTDKVKVQPTAVKKDGHHGKPGDGKPGDGKPGDGKPGDGKPGDGHHHGGGKHQHPPNWHQHRPPYGSYYWSHPRFGYGYWSYPAPIAPAGYYYDQFGRVVPNGFAYNTYGQLVPTAPYAAPYQYWNRNYWGRWYR